MSVRSFRETTVPHSRQWRFAKVVDRMLEIFWDDKGGGFFLTPKDGETLLIRPKEIYDGALPSGNSVALNNLLRLENLTANPDLGVKARLLIKAFSKWLINFA